MVRRDAKPLGASLPTPTSSRTKAMRAPRRRAVRFTDEDQARLVELAAGVQVHEEIVLANRVTAAVGRTIDPIAWRLHEMGYHVGFAVDDAANVGQP